MEAVAAKLDGRGYADRFQILRTNLMTKLGCFCKTNLSILILLVCFGCATSASNLKLSEVPKDEVPFMGHIDVYVDGVVRTEHCYVEFTDEKESRKAYVSLDKTGWIFTHAKPGPTFISYALCNEGTVFKHAVEFRSRRVQFLPSNASQIAYFGHVTLKLADTLPGLAFLGAIGAVTKAAIESGHEDKLSSFVVESRMPEAQQEYQERFGEDASKAKLIEVRIVPAEQTHARKTGFN